MLTHLVASYRRTKARRIRSIESKAVYPSYFAQLFCPAVGQVIGPSHLHRWILHIPLMFQLYAVSGSRPRNASLMPLNELAAGSPG